ncbi:MAG: hypothetical protein EOP38_32205, partial [Rubrivivax sp.]
ACDRIPLFTPFELRPVHATVDQTCLHGKYYPLVIILSKLHTGVSSRSISSKIIKTSIACSLVAIGPDADGSLACYGRYWGALERVDCLHFEACYYQPIAWCIAHGAVRFEGGAQGEHKMARALMPVMTTSAHWLAHPSFADAVERFLAREGEGMNDYMEHLEARSPFRHPAPG